MVCGVIDNNIIDVGITRLPFSDSLCRQRERHQTKVRLGHKLAGRGILIRPYLLSRSPVKNLAVNLYIAADVAAGGSI